MDSYWIAYTKYMQDGFEKNAVERERAGEDRLVYVYVRYIVGRVHL